MTNQYGQLVLSQDDGREGINRQNNKHCFVLNGIKDGMVKIHYLGTNGLLPESVEVPAVFIMLKSWSELKRYGW